MNFGVFFRVFLMLHWACASKRREEALKNLHKEYERLLYEKRFLISKFKSITSELIDYWRSTSDAVAEQLKKNMFIEPRHPRQGFKTEIKMKMAAYKRTVIDNITTFANEQITFLDTLQWRDVNETSSPIIPFGNVQGNILNNPKDTYKAFDMREFRDYNKRMQRTNVPGKFAMYPVKTSVKLVADISKHFHKRCVLLLYDKTSHTASVELWRQLTAMVKLLSQQMLAVQAMELDQYIRFLNCRIDEINCLEDHGTLYCHKNPDLIILLQYNTKVKKFLLKVMDFVRWRYPVDICGHVWLLMIPYRGSLEQFFKDVNIRFDCQFLVVESSTKENISPLNILEVYRVDKGTPLRKKLVGTWVEGKDHQWTQPPLYKTRRDLEGLMLESLVLETNLKENCAFSMFAVITAEECEIYRALKQSVMARQESRSACTGRCNHLKVQIKRRQPLQEYDPAYCITPIYREKYAAFIGRNMTLVVKWSSYLKPFSSNLWGCTVACILVVSFFMPLLYYLGCYGEEDQPFRSPRETIFIVLGILFQQGHDTPPTVLSSRLVFITWFLTTLVLLTSYSASLLSIIMEGEVEDLPFNSYDEFVRIGTYRLITWPGTKDSSLLGDTPSVRHIHSKLKTLVKSTLITTEFHMAVNLCQKKHILFQRVSQGDLLKQFHVCQILSVPGTVINEPLDWEIEKRGPYTRLINHKIIRMRETGVLAHIQYHGPEINYEAEDAFSRVEVENVVPLFAIFLLGLIASFLIMIIELITFYREK